MCHEFSENSALSATPPSRFGPWWRDEHIGGIGRTWPARRYFLAPAASFFSGTRTIVWQCWHLTVFPRTSSGTESTFRQRRFGHKSMTAMSINNIGYAYYGLESSAPITACCKSRDKSPTFTAGSTL